MKYPLILGNSFFFHHSCSIMCSPKFINFSVYRYLQVCLLDFPWKSGSRSCPLFKIEILQTPVGGSLPKSSEICCFQHAESDRCLGMIVEELGKSDGQRQRQLVVFVSILDIKDESPVKFLWSCLLQRERKRERAGLIDHILWGSALLWPWASWAWAFESHINMKVTLFRGSPLALTLKKVFHE